MPETTAPSVRDTLIDALIASWGLPGRAVSALVREVAARDVDAILAALAVDHGDLAGRMADAILAATYPPDEWPDGPPGEGEMGTAREQADAALAVRCEQTARIVARLAQAEARAEHAEGELSSRRDHHDRWELEKAKREEAEAERDALKAAIYGALETHVVHRKVVHPSPLPDCTTCVMGVRLTRDLPKSVDSREEIERRLAALDAPSTPQSPKSEGAK